MKKVFKKILLAVILILLVIAAFNYQLIGYGIDQAQGQFKVIRSARPIAEALSDPQFPDSLKSTLAIVNEIKQFAIDSLKLKSSKNYTTVYDQQGKEILWVVTACDPYKFEPLMWSFPLIGSFTYKGFFDYQKAVDLAKSLKEQGYDIEMRSVSGWSTLGWFEDPILSNMLANGPGELANTIIHELTHGTIFIPDSMTFNENLATFIGTKGALDFLKTKYGLDSQEYMNHKTLKDDGRLFTRYIIQAANQLDMMYQDISHESDSIKEVNKTEFINQVMVNLDTLSFKNRLSYQGYFDKYRPNNAYFIAFLNYRERQHEFERLLEDSLDNQLAAFIGYWKLNYEK
jgi:predicted aminopeptidase